MAKDIGMTASMVVTQINNAGLLGLFNLALGRQTTMDVVCHGIGLALGVLTRVRSFGLMLIRVWPPYASGI